MGNRCCVLLGECDDPVRRFQAFVHFGHQSHADAVAARIDAVRLARQVTARQNRHIIFGIQSLREFDIGQRGAADIGPQVKTGIGQIDLQHRLQQRRDLAEFLLVLGAIFHHVDFVVPGGVIVEENSVISMGVYIGQSTKIYDRTTGEVSYGRIPSGSVVVSGNLPSADGKYSLYCAVIVKRVDAQTRSKTGINELLRDA